MIVKKIPQSYSGLIREEEDGSFVFTSAAAGKPQVMNRTVYEIWQLCDSKSIKEITDAMARKYRSVPIEKLQSDVNCTIWGLVNIGMLQIEGENEMMVENVDLAFTMLGEEDFVNASAFIARIYDNGNTETFFRLSLPDIDVKDPGLADTYYSTISMRLRQVTNKELFFKYSKQDSDRIDAIIGIQILPNNKVVYISTIMLKNEQDFPEILQLLGSYLKDNGVKLLKARWIEAEDKDYAPKFAYWGFQKECVLATESLSNHDILVHSTVLA